MIITWISMHQSKYVVQLQLSKNMDLFINNADNISYKLSCMKFAGIYSIFTALVNSLRPRVNRSPLANDIFKCIFLSEYELISPMISLKFVPKVGVNNIPALVQKMAWRQPGDKPLSGPMMVCLLTHICVTRPQSVKIKAQSEQATSHYFDPGGGGYFIDAYMCHSARRRYDMTTLWLWSNTD